MSGDERGTLTFEDRDASGAVLPFLSPGEAVNEAVNVETPVPFTLGVVPWRQGGALRVTVVVKASFSAMTSPMRPAASPEPYRVADAHHRNQPMARVVAASDRAPRKPRVDVTALGHACTKGGLPRPEARVRLSLVQGGATVIDKALRIVGARTAADAEPVPFVRMPITYERAFGGIGTPENPIGCGEDEEDDFPNVLHPDDPEKPVGYGPIASAWPIRKKRLGAASPRDVESALISLPDDFDLSFFQSAPPDQQIDELAPDATLVLEGFHPDKERIEIALPSARAVGAVYGLDAARPEMATPIDFRADALHIDADTWIATITFRGSVTIPDESRLPELVVATGIGLGGRAPIIPAERPGPEQIQSAASLSPATKDAAEPPSGGTLVFAQTNDTGGTLPFAPSAARSSDTLVLPLSNWSKGPTRDLSAATLALPPRPSLAGPLPPPAPLISPPALIPSMPESKGKDEEPPAPIAAEAEETDVGKRPEEIVDLERYGSLSAALAEPKAKLADVLKKEKITIKVWREADRFWRRELDREAKERGRDKRQRFDEAWVRAFEILHPGRFGLEHYARLASAEKKARLPNELAAQALPTEVGMRLRRVWRGRIAADPALREALSKITASGA